MFKTFLKRLPIEPVNWYHAASPEDRREYDAFGPWIMPVRDEAGMPRRFRPAYPRVRDARFLLKVPCDADRRAVRPGMDLYRAVLAVRDAGITLLTLEPEGYASRDLAWGDIVAVQCYQNLLLSRWTLLLADGTEACLAYNTVGKELMDQVTGYVRERIRTAADPGARPGRERAQVDDFFFRAMHREVQRWGPPAAPQHFDRPNRPCRNPQGRRRISTGNLVLDAGGELIVVDRERPMRSRFRADYAYRRTFIPYPGIRSFAVAANDQERAPRFHTLALELAGRRFDIPCLDAPLGAVEDLKEHGIPERGGREA